MGIDARKPVFGVSNQVICKPACSATETIKNIVISREVNNKDAQNAGINLLMQYFKRVRN